MAATPRGAGDRNLKHPAPLALPDGVARDGARQSEVPILPLPASCMHRLARRRFVRSLTSLVLLAACAAPQVDAPGRNGTQPTEPVIDRGRLELLLHAFAHDSMEGRAAGSEGARRAARFLAAELERLGVRPAGENGSYLQSVPLVWRSASPASAVHLGGEPLTWGTDYLLARPVVPPPPARDVEALVAGRIGTAQRTWLDAEHFRGKALVLLPPAAAIRQFRSVIPAHPDQMSRAAHAAVIIYVLPEPIDEAQRQAARQGDVEMSFASRPGTPAGPPTLFLSPAAAQRLFGRPVEQLRTGDRGGPLTVDLRILEEPRPTYNVVAVIPGSDPALRGQYVAIGAHLDHEGVGRATDADSIRAYAIAVRELRRANGWRVPTREQVAAIRIDMDSLRRVHPQPRDSIFNGADDDASGSVAMLEIARSLRERRPKRSILLVWHTAEELGLYGAEYFTDHPTVPRDSIVAQLNVDMIGRGTAADGPDGGPSYLQLIGSRRLSSELGTLVEEVNAARERPFGIDYRFDAEGHPQQYYCRSDHYMYARYGIPVAFFTTGSHVDYHAATDHAEYIDYAKLTDVAQLVHDVALRIADRPSRLTVDGLRPDPRGECVQ